MKSNSLKTKVTKSKQMQKAIKLLYMAIQSLQYTIYNNIIFMIFWKSCNEKYLHSQKKNINKDSSFNTDYFRITAASEELVVFKDWMEHSIGDYIKLLLLTKTG